MPPHSVLQELQEDHERRKRENETPILVHMYRTSTWWRVPKGLVFSS